MILVVNVCKERLHSYEFVKPVEDVLKKEGLEFETFHYKQLDNMILARAEKVIICGTSLKDDEFLSPRDDSDEPNAIDKFKDMFSYFDLHNKDVKVLGICAGFQILGLCFDGKMGKSVEIGFYHEDFVEDFLGLKGDVEVYHLHGNYVDFPLDWRIYSGVDFSQAVRKGNYYGVLFHPEVRNKEMILEFARL